MKKLTISSFLLCLLLAGCAQEAGPSPLACNQDMAASIWAPPTAPFGNKAAARRRSTTQTSLPPRSPAPP